MTELPHRRWAPGFVAMRWRHVFWVLPLVGIAIGLLAGYLDFRKKNAATGIVQVLPIHGVGFHEMLAALESEEVLSSTIRQVNLTDRWKMEHEECLPSLNGRVRIRNIRGTSLAEISILGMKSTETVEICASLIENFTIQMEARESAAVQARFDLLEDAISQAKSEVESTRAALEASVQSHFDTRALNKDRSTLLEDGDSRQEDYNKALRNLSNARSAFLNELSHERLFGSVILHEAPSLDPLPTWEILRPFLLFAGIGLTAGVGLTVIVAYLLEAAFPRKSPLEQALAA